jgi:hypothetical protein
MSAEKTILDIYNKSFENKGIDPAINVGIPMRPFKEVVKSALSGSDDISLVLRVLHLELGSRRPIPGNYGDALAALSFEKPKEAGPLSHMNAWRDAEWVRYDTNTEFGALAYRMSDDPAYAERMKQVLKSALCVAHTLERIKLADRKLSHTMPDSYFANEVRKEIESGLDSDDPVTKSAFKIAAHIYSRVLGEAYPLATTAARGSSGPEFTPAGG